MQHIRAYEELGIRELVRDQRFFFTGEIEVCI